MRLLFLDFESYYSTETDYDLKSISILEYVRSPQFKVHGVGLALGDAPPHWVTTRDIPTVFAAIDWSQTIVVAHNAKFDGFILRNLYGVKPAGWICTLGMSRAVLGKMCRGASLADVADYYGFEPKGMMLTSGVRDLLPEQEKALAEYCLHDVDLCRKIYHKMAPTFPASQEYFLDWTIRTFVEPKLVLNVPLLEETTASELARKEKMVAALGKTKAVFSSNPKFADLLRSMGYECPMKKSPRTGDMIPALAMGDEDFLDMLYSENDELRQLCEARAAVKSTLLETRSRRLAAIGRTGTWSFDVQFSGAKQTHRYSGGSGAGGNPQNFTRGSALRKAVEAPAGHLLVVGDFSMVECRLVAYLANDPALIAALAGDPYCDFASMFYGRSITKKDDRERRFGKEAILGLGYGMGVKKFKYRVKIKTGQTLSDEEAFRAVDLYRSRYIRVQELWQQLDDAIQTLATGMPSFSLAGLRFEKEQIALPSNLPIRYPNLHREFTSPRNAEWIYEAYGKSKNAKERPNLYGGKVLENVCQYLAGILCKEAARPFGDLATGNVHDEIHLVVPEEHATEYVGLLKAAMETSPRWMPQIKLKAEVAAGKNWLDAK